MCFDVHLPYLWQITSGDTNLTVYKQSLLIRRQSEQLMNHKPLHINSKKAIQVLTFITLNLENDCLTHGKHTLLNCGVVAALSVLFLETTLPQ